VCTHCSEISRVHEFRIGGSPDPGMASNLPPSTHSALAFEFRRRSIASPMSDVGGRNQALHSPGSVISAPEQRVDRAAGDGTAPAGPSSAHWALPHHDRMCVCVCVGGRCVASDAHGHRGHGAAGGCGGAEGRAASGRVLAGGTVGGDRRRGRGAGPSCEHHYLVPVRYC
jgi:hypothetical protein